MALATFHSLRGEKSALILVRPNAFVFSATPVYVPATAIPAGTEEGAIIEIPDGYKIVPMVDTETGEIRTSESGAQLCVLAY